MSYRSHMLVSLDFPADRHSVSTRETPACRVWPVVRGGGNQPWALIGWRRVVLASGQKFDSFDPAVWLTASIRSVARRGMVTHDPIREARAATARGDYQSAITVLRPLAESGNGDAQYELGFLALTECELISGHEAFSLFMKAAQSGHVEAMYHLATFPDFISEPFRSPLSEEETWQ